MCKHTFGRARSPLCSSSGFSRLEATSGTGALVFGSPLPAPGDLPRCGTNGTLPNEKTAGSYRARLRCLWTCAEYTARSMKYDLIARYGLWTSRTSVCFPSAQFTAVCFSGPCQPESKGCPGGCARRQEKSVLHCSFPARSEQSQSTLCALHFQHPKAKTIAEVFRRSGSHRQSWMQEPHLK